MIQIKFNFSYVWPTFTWVIALCKNLVFRTFFSFFCDFDLKFGIRICLDIMQIKFDFCGVWPLLKFRFPDFSDIDLKFHMWICLDLIQVKINFCRVWSTFLCLLRSIGTHKDHFVCASVCMSGNHTFLVVTHSYVSQATHAFLRILPLCYWVIALWKNLVFQTFLCPLLTAYGTVSGGGQLLVDFRGLRSFVVDVTICRVSATALLCRFSAK